jgi:hypothetical protein
MADAYSQWKEKDKELAILGISPRRMPGDQAGIMDV